MKIIADRTLCAGHARCAAVAPDLMELDEVGFIAFDEREVPADVEDKARRGVRACPERALTLVED